MSFVLRFFNQSIWTYKRYGQFIETCLDPNGLRQCVKFGIFDPAVFIHGETLNIKVLVD